MEVKFTARMEGELDRISEGEQDWLESLRKYYTLLDKDLKKGMKTESVKEKGIPVEETCPRCGRSLVIKEGRYGRFKSCSGYPECKYKESLFKKEAEPLDEKCPQCSAQLILRQGRYGTFIACSNYPRCTYIKKEKTDTGLSCPQGCGGTIVKRKTRKGKVFFGCSFFPKCKFATWDNPVAKPCPNCGRTIVFLKSPKKGEPYLYCWDKNCKYRETAKKEKEENSSPEP